MDNNMDEKTDGKKSHKRRNKVNDYVELKGAYTLRTLNNTRHTFRFELLIMKTFYRL